MPPLEAHWKTTNLEAIPSSFQLADFLGYRLRCTLVLRSTIKYFLGEDRNDPFTQIQTEFCCPLDSKESFNVLQIELVLYEATYHSRYQYDSPVKQICVLITNT